MIVALVSIIVLTSLVWVFNHVAKTRLCPICAGVAGTWLWMFAAHLLGLSVDLLSIGILMGGSVVGIVYQVERTRGAVLSLAAKTLVMLSGFLLAYTLLDKRWLLAGVALIVGALILFWRTTPRQAASREKHAPSPLEKEMESCC